MAVPHGDSLQRRHAGGWATLGLAIYLAGCGSTAPVSPSSRPLDAASPPPSRLPESVAVGRLAIEYGAVGDIALMVESRSGAVGFGDGVPGLSYGSIGQGPYGEVEDARGVVIAEITGATFHANAQPAAAEDATAFIANMDALKLTDGSDAYTVGAITAAEFAGFPALAADVEAQYGYPFLEMGEASHVIYLGMPQRLIVADVDGAIVLIQVWAATDSGLDAWLPTATSLTESMRVAGSP